MRQTLKTGIKVVSAPQLFPTPPELARRLMELAEVLPGQRVLEPSAGTGNLLRAIFANFTGPDCGHVTAVEKNAGLVSGLIEMRQRTIGANDSNFVIRHQDFLDMDPAAMLFHRVVMNPPFANGDDIRHIIHAIKFLRPGGILAAICANGPRQQARLCPLATEWHRLPPGQFSTQGTGVNTAIFVFRS